MLVVFLAFLWIVAAALVGRAAGARGRGAFAWFLLSLLMSPVLAVLFLLAFPVVPMQTGESRRREDPAMLAICAVVLGVVAAVDLVDITGAMAWLRLPLLVAGVLLGLAIAVLLIFPRQAGRIAGRLARHSGSL